MGNSDLKQFPNEGLKLRTPPSPKLIVSGNMSQSKTTTGSPKSPKSPDDNSKSDGTSSTSLLKSGRSPSSAKTSTGNTKSLSLAERLAQSTIRGSKSSPPPKSPGSKSPPISPNTLTSSKTDVFKESTDQCLKSDEVEKNIHNDESVEILLENTQLIGEKQVIVENGINESNEVKSADASLDSNQFESCLSEGKENDVIKSDSNEVLENKELENVDKPPMRIDDSVILEQSSKKNIRQKVWEFLEEKSLVVFPKPCFNRIPNFKGCINASLSLEKLEEFKKAKTVQVTPDKAQETARFITLSWGKRLLVPLLRLKEGLLQEVSLPFAEPSIKMLKSASTQKGLRKWGKRLITLDQNIGDHIDMIILGSVAVDKKGQRIGIGNGFCDLEFVILSTMNMVTDKTVVVTIVHDAQVFETLPSDIFKPFDVPVDIIVTPNEVIKVENRLHRPKNVLWNYISKRRLLEMPPLQVILTKQENDTDLVCTLKEVDSEPEEIPPSPKTYMRSYKRYRKRRTLSTRSDTNDSVFKDTEVSKRSSSKQSSVLPSKNNNSKAKGKRAKSTSSQKHQSRSTDRNTQNEQKELHSSSKKPNKRRTKSESAKAIISPVTEPKNTNNNEVQAEVPSSETPKNKRQSRQKPRHRIRSDDIDKQSIHQADIKLNNGNNKPSSRSNSRVTRRDYVDRQDVGRDMSLGRKSHRDYVQSPKKYYSQSRHHSQNRHYSQERIPYERMRSNSRMQRRDSSRSVNMQQNRYSNGPVIRQTRYFNGSSSRHNSFNGSVSSHQNNGNYHAIRHNSYSNDSLPRQNGYYNEVINRRNSYSKGSGIRQDGYTNSRVFRPPQYRNGMTSQNNERDYIRESRPHYNNNRPGYYSSNEKQNYARSINGDEFVLKVGNIANNVRVRDLKAALLERQVKPLHITWRGPRGFAYLRYQNSGDVNKDNVIGSLQNVRIMPNGVETAQTQTLIVTECQFS